MIDERNMCASVPRNHQNTIFVVCKACRGMALAIPCMSDEGENKVIKGKKNHFGTVEMLY